MLQTTLANTLQLHQLAISQLAIVPDMSRLSRLTENDRVEVLAFLAVRPVHTVVMTSFIVDNGLESALNRGKFFGFRGPNGKLEGVALIGHSTLVEARTDEALRALAVSARKAEMPIHLVMSSGNAAERFWNYLALGASPRLTCREALFEAALPFAVKKRNAGLRPASMDEILPVAEAQAEVAFMECGIDPMLKDREGFLKRVARRIEQERIFVVFDGDNLVFKADIIAETSECIYLEGVYVGEEYRGQGIGSTCLSNLTLDLLGRTSNICMLSNVDFESAHKSYAKAGFKKTDECVTLFV
ncbi:MAG: GNAT family N-acetyltransferase [Acidobacteria bacterium]|nr:GNAT family N-acetyltransferase [Acidobacteriota bacterium]